MSCLGHSCYLYIVVCIICSRSNGLYLCVIVVIVCPCPWLPLTGSVDVSYCKLWVFRCVDTVGPLNVVEELDAVADVCYFGRLVVSCRVCSCFRSGVISVFVFWFFLCWWWLVFFVSSCPWLFLFPFYVWVACWRSPNAMLGL